MGQSVLAEYSCVRGLLATPICVLPPMDQYEHGACARIRKTSSANGLLIGFCAARISFGQPCIIHPFVYILCIVSAYANAGSSCSKAIEYKVV